MQDTGTGVAPPVNVDGRGAAYPGFGTQQSSEQSCSQLTADHTCHLTVDACKPAQGTCTGHGDTL